MDTSESESKVVKRTAIMGTTLAVPMTPSDTSNLSCFSVNNREGMREEIEIELQSLRGDIVSTILGILCYK